MAEISKGLALEDKVKAENILYASMYDRSEWKIFTGAGVVAILLHVAVLFFHFPEIKATLQPAAEKKQVVVRKYTPPPPKVKQKQVVKKKITKKVPIPDPTPDEPEPIREPEPEIEEMVIPDDVEIMIGTPEPPPPSGPLLAGVGDVSNPILDEASKQTPEYPELARVARVEGNVILQAVVRADGSVGDMEVLRCNRPNMGFEEAAIEAVKNWSYKPATQNGRPVDVFFTVYVDFKLH